MDSFAAVDYWIAVFAVVRVIPNRRISPRFRVLQNQSSGQGVGRRCVYRKHPHLRVIKDALCGRGIPCSVTHLSVASKCCQELSNLPATLTSLILGADYNRSLPALPTSLRSLSLGESFLGEVPELPAFLTSLVMHGVAYPLPPLPEHLRTFHVGRIHGTLPALPSALTYLCIRQGGELLIPGLPGQLEVLAFDGSADGIFPPLPVSLRALLLGASFCQTLPDLPESLQVLTFTGLFNCPVNKLPSGLLSFHLGEKFNRSLPTLPVSLTSLHLGYSFNQPLPALPPTLTSLCIGHQYCCRLNGQGCAWVFARQKTTSFYMCHCTSLIGVFNYALPLLPRSLRILGLPKTYAQPVLELPEHLTVLFLRGNFEQVVGLLQKDQEQASTPRLAANFCIPGLKYLLPFPAPLLCVK